MEKSGPERNILVTVGDTCLTEDEVVRQIPSGLEEADSLALFRRLVSSWVEARILNTLAVENAIDTEEIDRLTEEYRRRLLIDEYLKRMSIAERKDVTTGAIRDYYDQHPDEFILEEPILKGKMVRLSAEDPALETVRTLMQGSDGRSLDKLETLAMDRGIEFEYFGDNWTGWNSLSSRIPYRFEDGNRFLKTGMDFETEKDGIIWLLHIEEWVPAGGRAPYEYAEPYIAGILTDVNTSEARERLLRSIYVKAVKDKKLIPGLYNPISNK